MSSDKEVILNSNVDELEPLGQGNRRRCFRISGNDLCVKFYLARSEYNHTTKLSIRLNIWLSRFISCINANCHEAYYHKILKDSLPPDLFAVFPERVERIFSPERGWGVLESLVLNQDGSPLRRVLVEMETADKALRQRLFDETRRLFRRLAEHAVCFYDPPNVMVQWTGPGTFRLRIVDFEPRGRELMPCLSHIKPYVRLKVRRRCGRYLERLRVLLASFSPDAVAH